MFSRRTPRDLAPNALARLRADGGPVPFDLTVSNPTACGIPCPEDFLEPLARREGLSYRPDPRGLLAAREAVAEQYRTRRRSIDPASIVLTASSSEAYSFLFKLLCDPGACVLMPTPSYPLFEHLAALDGVRVRPYRLDPDDGWRPDPESIGASLEGGARGVIAVHPNNPTGSYLDRRTSDRLVAVCARAGVPLVADEVFLDYTLDPEERPESFAGTEGALTFTLGGLSKSIGLPQLKLSWIVASGPAPRVREALRRLEFVADNYLSVATPVQLALPELLSRGAAVRGRILERCRANLAALRAAVAAVPAVTVLPAQGGWSAVLRFPSSVAEEALALDLLRLDGVAIHPGYFFDFPREGYCVVSLLPPPADLAEGARRLLARIASRL